RTVKRDRADDSAHACVKVGHRQTNPYKTPCAMRRQGVYVLKRSFLMNNSYGIFLEELCTGEVGLVL
ncbi:MAG: hypothetical protein J0L85_14160, partial [Zoogloea sp.]|nr:hypothetical protein [Zoogloea sp.]